MTETNFTTDVTLNNTVAEFLGVQHWTTIAAVQVLNDISLEDSRYCGLTHIFKCVSFEANITLLKVSSNLGQTQIDSLNYLLLNGYVAN